LFSLLLSPFKRVGLPGEIRVFLFSKTGHS
jgi:hypothetical protein